MSLGFQIGFQFVALKDKMVRYLCFHGCEWDYKVWLYKIPREGSLHIWNFMFVNLDGHVIWMQKQISRSRGTWNELQNLFKCEINEKQIAH